MPISIELYWGYYLFSQILCNFIIFFIFYPLIQSLRLITDHGANFPNELFFNYIIEAVFDYLKSV